MPHSDLKIIQQRIDHLKVELEAAETQKSDLESVDDSPSDECGATGYLTSVMEKARRKVAATVYERVMDDIKESRQKKNVTTAAHQQVMDDINEAHRKAGLDYFDRVVEDWYSRNPPELEVPDVSRPLPVMHPDAAAHLRHLPWPHWRSKPEDVHPEFAAAQDNPMNRQIENAIRRKYVKLEELKKLEIQLSMELEITKDVAASRKDDCDRASNRYQDSIGRCRHLEGRLTEVRRQLHPMNQAGMQDHGLKPGDADES